MVQTPTPRISYAKNSEDILLDRVLHDIRRGFYLDIGASDPLMDSATALLYEKGWRGINVPTLESSFSKLSSHRMWEHTLQQSADLTALLEELHPENIHFLRITREEAKKGIFEHLDLTRFRPWIILLEAIELHDAYEPTLIGHGYTFVYSDGTNRFYLAHEHAERARCFTPPSPSADHYIRYEEWERESRLEELKEHIRTQDKIIKKARLDYQKAHKAHQNLSHELHLITHSFSWRILYPLRLAGKIRRRITDIPWMMAKVKPLLVASPYLMRQAYALRDKIIASRRPTAQSPLLGRILADRANFRSSDPADKPRLVFVSPLPPAKSGIADYALRLLAALKEHYTLLVVCETSSEPLPFSVTVRSAEEHLSHGSALDRHLYHFGNSHYHAWMLPLIERFPGTVVLHDLFLGGLYHSLIQQNPTASIERHLFDDHGYEALHCLADHGIHETLIRYPLNQTLMAQSDTVLVHSEYSFSRLHTPHRAKIPFPKELPEHPLTPLEAKTALGFKEDDFLVCTFGFIGHSKCSRELLLSWKESSLCRDRAAHLIFVGELPSGVYAEELVSLKESLPQGSTVTFTGYTDRYDDYLCASDLIVQLRRNSRGETSAAAFDALSYGRPLLVNAHGTMTEFPEDTLIRLPDEFTLPHLSMALEEIRSRPLLREQVGRAAQEYIKRHHNPCDVARRYRDAIEEGYVHGAYAHYRSALQHDPLDPSSLRSLLTPKHPPKIFVDISDVASHDLRTGIQRVVRSILRYLQDTPRGYRIEPVRLVEGRYRHAHTFMHKWLDISLPPLSEEEAQMGEGDIFLGLDLYVGHISQNPHLFEQMHAQGVKIHFVVYDILPLRYPHFFPADVYPQFFSWLGIITRYSEALECISESVAQDVRDWVQKHPQSRTSPLTIASFPLGADLQNSSPTRGITAEQHQLLSSLTHSPIILMVGTIEPRKAHAQALAAMEILWEAGEEIQLVIVGKKGWQVEELIQKLETHPRRNRSLFWFSGASDELLDHLYAASTLLLAASYGEGFGLPLIEAAQHAIPLLVRDIPVFREVAADHAAYFHADTPDQLADAIRAWLVDPSTPSSASLPYESWETSARKLLALLPIGA
ncbi:glycosyltransferase [Sulfuricurvum sp.]|uniref:glycosyltransferase n=1 Tax=Sulfuricurvum sp. TaxID=2025608 RepID=UPI003568C035